MNTNMNINGTNQNQNEINLAGRGPVTKGAGVMSNIKNIFKLKNAVIATAAAVTGLVAAPRNSSAEIVTLQNGNSIVKLAQLSSDNTPDGLYSWSVDGTQVAAQQQFYFRQDDTGPGVDLGTMSPSEATPPVVTLSTTGSGPANYASISYQGPGFTLNARYELLGGSTGSDQSELIEQMIVTNVSTHSIPVFRMVDYTDLNLSPGGTSDTAMANATGMQIIQTGANNTLANPSYTGLMAVATTSTMPNEFEVDGGGTGAGGLNSMIRSGVGIPLDDNTNSSGDVAFAQEYDQTIAPGGSLVFSVATVISPTVPEPASSAAVLLSAGGIFMMRPRRRDEDPDPRMACVAGA